MTASLEKLFLTYIIKNKKYFDIVKPNFFKNAEIQFVYSCIRKYMTANIDAEVPSAKQIYEMVNLDDREGKITKEIFISILKVDLTEYDETRFIKPKFKSWILINRIKEGTIDAIDETRNIEELNDYDSVVEVSNKIKSIVDASTKLDFDIDQDMGSDFDDPDCHSQDHAQTKIKSGYSTVDHILSGGFDVATLNLLFGSTNSGKSIWMQNFAVGSANAGHNVLYITLEMSEKKVLKRMGAMRLKIPINEYDNLSMDKDFIKGKINNLNKSGSGNINDLFENKVGKIRVKFWSAGIATVAHIDNLLADYLSKMNMKFDMLVVDYLTLLAPPKGADTLYIKGKVIAEGLRALAAKYQLAVISATQIDKDMWGADSIDISSGSESKSIPETCDTMWGIIRSEEMKRNNKYRLKLLKQRDGSFDKSMIMFDLNPVYLSIENEMFLDQI